jgi:hypothetical protein
LAAIHIVRPGPGARLTTPVLLQANAIPGADNTVLIQLIGEDGRVIASETQYFTTPQGQRVGLLAALDFQIAGVAEAARLQLSTRDARSRLIALASTDIVLLASGSDEIGLEPDPHEPFFLLAPGPNGTASGGALPISGYLRPANRQPVIFELIDGEGKILGSASFSPTMDAGAYQPLVASLPYTVSASTWARLTIRQADARLPGDACLSSVPVFLNP